MDDFVKGVEVVIHLAAKISIDADPTGMVRRINVEGTRNVVEACKKHGVKKLIHFSSIHAFNPYPLEATLDENRELRIKDASDYDQSKIDSEKLVFEAAKEGLNACIIAPTSVFGPNDFYPSLLGQAILDIYKRKIPMLIPGGYDFVYVDDIVHGTISAIEKGRKGEKYLFSGHYLSIQQLAKLIGELGNVQVTKRVLPFWVLRLLIPFFKLQSTLTRKQALFTRESLKALKESPRKISSAKAEKELGYHKTPSRKAFQQTLEWFVATA